MTKWTSRKDNTKTRSWVSIVMTFIEMINGDQTEEFWSHVLTKRPTLRRHLSENMTDKENKRKLDQLKANYQEIVPQLNRFTPATNMLKDNMLMLVNDVLSKQEQLSAGSVVGEATYSCMRQHVQNNGMSAQFEEDGQHLFILKSNLKKYWKAMTTNFSTQTLAE